MKLFFQLIPEKGVLSFYWEQCDKVKADLEKKEKGIYEISIKDEKVSTIVSELKKKLEPNKYRVFKRNKQCFVEAL